MRRRRIPLGIVLLPVLLLAGAPLHAQKATGAPAEKAEAGPIALAIRDAAGGAFKRFYADRDFQPIWVAGGRIGRQADTLIGYLESARLDGLKPSSYDIGELRAAIDAARGGDTEALVRAELKLSAAFARFVQDQRRGGRVRMIYAESSLKPKKKLRPEAVLRAATFRKSFNEYLNSMAWMNPQYVKLREAAGRAEKRGMSPEAMARLGLNLDRARLLPGPWTHHIVVDASSGRLWYYGEGKQAGTMRVVVGAKEAQTPMLAGTLQWAILNPYWNVPTYLARKSVAPKVMGGRSLTSLHMEALSDWSNSPTKLAASSIDWSAVASGKSEVRLRELPWAGNSMGKVKFLFPNDEGIYLHDTPERDLLKKTDRHFSNGCIRLENAAALGRWLMQRPLPRASKEVEQAVPLPVPVPVYLTYITAEAGDTGVSFRDDVYGRDGAVR